MTNQAEPAPIIVHGPLRSGTTVFRLMLDAHPQISNPGEFDYIFSYAQLRNGRLWYDRGALKKHRGFQDSGLVMDESASDQAIFESFIRQLRARKEGAFTFNVHHRIESVRDLLPGARFIRLLRDPRDVSKSCIEMGWAANTYHAVNHWIEVETAWERMKQKIPADDYLEVRFEDLVVDSEAVLRKVCSFLGVAYDPVMLRYPETSTYSAPDPSVAYKWRKRMPESAARLASVKAQALITARGYEIPAGVRAPGAMQRLALAVHNRIGIWQFGMRRHGALVYMIEKLARRLGMKKMHGMLVDRINDNNRLAIK